MSVDTKYGEAIFKQTQEVAEMFKAAMPKITTNKNGYEIRTKVLEMAQNNGGSRLILLVILQYMKMLLMIDSV